MENESETACKNKFDLEKAIADIKSHKNDKYFYQKMEVYLIRITKDGNEIYKKDCKKKSKKILFESLEEEMDRLEKRTIIPYDILMSKKNTLESVTTSDYPNIVEELHKFDDENCIWENTKNVSVDDFNLYMVKLEANDNYKIFGSYSGILKLKKKYIFGNFTDSMITLSEKDITFGFGKKIEMMAVNNQFILINQAETKFENLFKMKQLFSVQAVEILDENNELKNLLNEETRERLKEKVKNHTTLATKLIKYTSDQDRFKQTVSGISKIQNIISNKTSIYHGKIKDVKYKSGQLTVKKGKEGQLLYALSDSFYKAYFSNVESIDKSRT